MSTSALALPDFACVMVTSNEQALVDTLWAQSFAECARLRWDVNSPASSTADLKALLQSRRQVYLELHPARERTLVQISNLCRVLGADCLSLVLPGQRQAFDHIPKIEHHQLDTLAPTVVRRRIPFDLSDRPGPFDIIGDVHGCYDELCQLLVELGHARWNAGELELQSHPDGRQVALVGDLVDRGPQNVAVLRLAFQLARDHRALVIRGNHDDKLIRYLEGANIVIRPDLQATIAEYEDITAPERAEITKWLQSLPTHFVLDAGRLVIAHAGLPEHLHHAASRRAKAFALYGEPTGQIDDEGYPMSADWAQEYSGSAYVVHGHVVHEAPRILNRVVAIDTGCVFGGHLTAFRWPEAEFTSIKARMAYSRPRTRPNIPPEA